LERRFSARDVELLHVCLCQHAQAAFGIVECLNVRSFLGVETELAIMVAPAMREVVDGDRDDAAVLGLLNSIEIGTLISIIGGIKGRAGSVFSFCSELPLNPYRINCPDSGRSCCYRLFPSFHDISPSTLICSFARETIKKGSSVITRQLTNEWSIMPLGERSWRRA
jgi:hypothetical protein